MQKNIKIWSIVSITLLIILMNSTVFAKSSTSATGNAESDLILITPKLGDSIKEEGIPLDLELPTPIPVKIDGIKYWAWDVIGYSIIIQMQIMYTDCPAAFANLLEFAEEQEKLIEIKEKRIKILNTAVDTFQDDINEVYDIYKSELKVRKKQNLKNKIKMILVGGGTGLVGLGAGIIIGFFAVR